METRTKRMVVSTPRLGKVVLGRLASDASGIHTVCGEATHPGLDARWRTREGTIWFSVDRYDQNNRGDGAIQDWSQWRSALGFSYYLGSEPGRTP